LHRVREQEFGAGFEEELRKAETTLGSAGRAARATLEQESGAGVEERSLAVNEREWKAGILFVFIRG
jgi:hypothetical protein